MKKEAVSGKDTAFLVQEKIGKIIREMLEILFEEEQMFADYAKRKTFIKENITVYCFIILSF